MNFIVNVSLLTISASSAAHTHRNNIWISFKNVAFTFLFVASLHKQISIFLTKNEEKMQTEKINVEWRWLSISKHKQFIIKRHLYVCEMHNLLSNKNNCVLFSYVALSISLLSKEILRNTYKKKIAFEWKSFWMRIRKKEKIYV